MNSVPEILHILASNNRAVRKALYKAACEPASANGLSEDQLARLKGWLEANFGIIVK